MEDRLSGERAGVDDDFSCDKAVLHNNVLPGCARDSGQTNISAMRTARDLLAERARD